MEKENVDAQDTGTQEPEIKQARELRGNVSGQELLLCSDELRVTMQRSQARTPMRAAHAKLPQ